jgi:hypothetical protein
VGLDPAFLLVVDWADGEVCFEVFEGLLDGDASSAVARG